jgi:signal transduction histidine kinase
LFSRRDIRSGRFVTDFAASAPEEWSAPTMPFRPTTFPAFPKREGTNPHGEKDANGKMFHDEFLKPVQTSGAGWVDYMSPKPGQTQPSHKWSYVKGFKADGMAGLIGAGFFPE